MSKPRTHKTRKLIEEGKVIQRLREMIPESNIKCLKECNGCCGPVPFSKWEWRQIKDKREHKTLVCPYWNPEIGCDIYDDRPIMCRLFGASDVAKLKCPHGCNSTITLSNRETEKITLEYRKIFNSMDAGTPWLPSKYYDAAIKEIDTLLKEKEKATRGID